MIEIEQALQLIEQQISLLDSQSMRLVDAVGHVFASDAVSDVDSPPFDKSMMDGLAIRGADYESGLREFEVVEWIRAGMMPLKKLKSGQASQIMTGAPLPQGGDSVVMVEQTYEKEQSDKPRMVIEATSFSRGQNVLRRAQCMGRGDVVGAAGQLIRAEDVGLLAEAGVAMCDVVRRPGLAVIATGDELVELDQKPAAGEIRNSNGPMICAMARPLCHDVVNLGIGIDDRDALGRLISEGLSRDVLVLSGGVSAGVADLVPSVLRQLGIQQVFHKVKIKPGKPIWFGKLAREKDRPPVLVFGLPGNPVSSLVCFHVFVAAALRLMAGRSTTTQYLTAAMRKAHRHNPGRTTYWPSRLVHAENAWQVTPLDWKGSADLKTLVQANSFVVFPSGESQFEVGQEVTVLRIP